MYLSLSLYLFISLSIFLSVQGLADVFQKLKLPFDSDEGRKLNTEIMETIYFAAVTHHIPNHIPLSLSLSLMCATSLSLSLSHTLAHMQLLRTYTHTLPR